MPRSFTIVGSLLMSALGMQSPVAVCSKEKVAIYSQLPKAALCLRLLWIHVKHLCLDRTLNVQLMDWSPVFWGNFFF